MKGNITGKGSIGIACLVLMILGIFTLFHWLHHKTTPREPGRLASKTGVTNHLIKASVPDHLENPRQKIFSPSPLPPDRPKSSGLPAQKTIRESATRIELATQDVIYGAMDVNAFLKEGLHLARLTPRFPPELEEETQRMEYSLSCPLPGVQAQLWKWPAEAGEDGRLSTSLSLRVEIRPETRDSLIVDEASRYGTSLEIDFNRDAEGKIKNLVIIAYMMINPVSSARVGLHTDHGVFPLGGMYSYSPEDPGRILVECLMWKDGEFRPDQDCDDSFGILPEGIQPELIRKWEKRSAELLHWIEKKEKKHETN